MNSPRVLVAAPISSHKDYVIQQYLESLKQLTYFDYDTYFVDNSYDPLWHIKNVVMKGFDCGYVSPNGKSNQEYITESQLKIREKALNGNYDYLMMIECDIIVPKTIIEQMLSYNKAVVVANYFIGNMEQTHLMKQDIEHKTFGSVTNRNQAALESFIQYGTQKDTSEIHGLGVVLIHKDVLKKIPFRLKKEHPDTHADTIFWMDCKQHEIKAQVHPIICKHYNSSWFKIQDAWQ